MREGREGERRALQIEDKWEIRAVPVVYHVDQMIPDIPEVDTHEKQYLPHKPHDREREIGAEVKETIVDGGGANPPAEESALLYNIRWSNDHHCCVHDGKYSFLLLPLRTVRLMMEGVIFM